MYKNSLESDSSMMFFSPKRIRETVDGGLSVSLNGEFRKRGQAGPKAGKGNLWSI